MQTPKKEVHFFFFSVCCIVSNCSWQLIMFDKKQKSCVKRIHLVTDDGLYDRKAFYTVKIVFYSSSMENIGFGISKKWKVDGIYMNIARVFNSLFSLNRPVTPEIEALHVFIFSKFLGYLKRTRFLKFLLVDACKYLCFKFYKEFVHLYFKKIRYKWLFLFLIESENRLCLKSCWIVLKRFCSSHFVDI